MATDPTRSIRRHDHPSVFDLSANELLDQVAALPAQAAVPYLVVTLDWSIAGGSPGRRSAPEGRRSEPAQDDAGSERPSRREMELEINRLIDAHGPRGDVFDALQASRDRINAWLASDLDPAAQGAYIVSHEPSGVFVATGLNLPMETTVALASVPRVYKLMRMIEDHPTYAVLQADQETATLSFITHGARDRSVKLESDAFPRRQSSGGLNQSRYKRRAEERIEAFARDTVEQVRLALDESGVDVLILAAAEVMQTALRDALPDNLDAEVASVRLQGNANSDEKIAATLPIAEAAERAREQAAVDRLKNAIGEGELGAAGAHDAIRKLQNGQVDTLILCDTFEGAGWADYELHLFGVGDVPAEHPAGGDAANLVAVDLREELVRLALATGAEVEIIHSATPVEDDAEVPAAGQDRPTTQAAAELVEMGGVGVVLRYALTRKGDQTTI